MVLETNIIVCGQRRDITVHKVAVEKLLISCTVSTITECFHTEVAWRYIAFYTYMPPATKGAEIGKPGMRPERERECDPSQLDRVERGCASRAVDGSFSLLGFFSLGWKHFSCRS